jgi:hypothetical protein
MYKCNRAATTLLICQSFPSGVTLLSNREFDTFASGKRNPGFDTLANDEDVRNTKVEINE